MLQSMLYTYSCFHAAVCRIKPTGILPCGDMPLHLLSIVCLCSVLFAACDVEDERDICCKRIVMEYQYMSGGQDCFEGNIRSLRHFLFNKAERFIEEIPCGETLQLQKLDSLEAGAYTMVTVGNAAEATVLSAPACGESLNNFMLYLAETDGADADPLFYGICRFAPQKEYANREQRFVTQMANVHCWLRVTVAWEHLPPAMTTAPVYRMVLENCAGNYELDGGQGYGLGEKRFPHSPAWKWMHKRDCGLKGFLLKEELVSLRYTNGKLPTLHILCKEGGEYVELTPPLDLKRSFSVWGFKPESTERQQYKIRVTIYKDGHIGVKVEAEAGVADWINGGNFG